MTVSRLVPLWLAVLWSIGCTGGAPSAETVQRYCVLSSSCGSGAVLAAGSVGSCTLTTGLTVGGTESRVVSPFEHAASCGTSSSCADFRSCLRYGHDDEYCMAHPTRSCDRNFLVDCTSRSGVASLDCDSLGMRCQVGGPIDWAACTNGMACAYSGNHCDGNRLVGCDPLAQLEFAYDCANTMADGVCGTRTVGLLTTVACLPRATCTNEGSISCDGTTVVTCTQGHEYRVDCAAIDARCVVSNVPGAFPCVPNATDCDVATFHDNCVGTRIQSCVNGRVGTVDCAAIGFTGCRATGTSARCFGCSNCPTVPDTLLLGVGVDGSITTSDRFTGTSGRTAGGVFPADPYTITLTAGTYTVRMCYRNRSSFDTYVEVLGPPGAFMDGRDFLGCDDGSGLQSLCTFEVVADGGFTVVAETLNGQAPDATFTPTAGDYTIRLDRGMVSTPCP